jgi:BirA family biotin operon repressor/biotin-[acetyl-CoA-carboxylase] ligase
LSAEHAALRLLNFLSVDEPRSGEAIARELGCSRSAVWKQVETLRQQGVGVESMTGSGYWLAEPIELLDAETIETHLGEREAACLNGLEIWPELDSTNAELQRRPPPRQHGLALFTERQTSGRGRHGRQWFSPLARNIYLSLGWRFEMGIGELSALPLVLALATADALADCGLEGHVIKWPNDLLKEGQKLAGCLVEVQGDASGPCAAVMGVGVNVHMPAGTDGADSIDQPWADVARFVPGISRNRLAGALLDSLLSSLIRFERQGFGAFQGAWNARDVLAGKAVDVFTPAGRVQGAASGVSSRGGLLVETDSGTRELHAGEVSLRS